MTRRKLYLIGLLLTLVCTISWATDGPTNAKILEFYAGAHGLKGSALKTMMYELINPNGRTNALGETMSTLSYNDLIDAYATTDLKPDGEHIWDMYSNVTNYKPSDNGSSFKKEGDGYNREHSVPQSWFDEKTPMRCDLFHVVPTDGYVNNTRNSYIFYTVTNIDDDKCSANKFSKFGTSTVNGKSGEKVFEPDDEYKGDFARIYFYMVTAYEATAAASFRSTNGSATVEIFQNNEYKPIQDWYLSMLMEWAKNDPVSEKEIKRNNAVYTKQHNRNPFVDYPGLEDLIWGNNTQTAFDYDNYTNPYGNGGGGGSGEETDSYVFDKVTTADQLVAGRKYLFVCESKQYAMSANASTGNYRTNALVTLGNNQISLKKINTNSTPHTFTLGGTTGAWTFYDDTENVYLALTSNSNALNSSESNTSNNERWKINIGSSATTIQNNNFTSRYIQYNASSPRFACYTSSQQAVALYVQQQPSDDPSDCGLAYKKTTATATYGENFTEPTLTNPYNVSVTFSSSDISVATIDANTGKVTIKKPGTTTITASFAGNEYYTSKNASYTLTVEKGEVNLAYSATTATVTLGEGLIAPVLKNPNNVAPITYLSSNTSVATIDEDGNVSTHTAGTTTITATFLGNEYYNEGSSSYVLTVNQPQIVVGSYFEETFGNCNGMGGNDNNWGGSGNIAATSIESKPDTYTDNKGWEFVKGFEAKECVKLGTGSSKGSATTPAIKSLKDKTLTLNFKAGAWNASDEGTTLKISGTGCTLSPSSVTLVKGKWTEFSIEITGTAEEVKITFESAQSSKNRFFLDEIKILNTQPTPTYKKGDINNDGEVSVEDLVLLVEILKGNKEDTYGRADVNEDGKVDSEDAEELVEIILNQ